MDESLRDSINLVINILSAVLVGVFLLLYSKEKKWFKFLSFLGKESVDSLEQKLFGFDNSVIPKMIVDEDGNVTSVNGELEKLLGWTEADYQKEGLKLIIPKRFLSEHMAGITSKKGEEMPDRVYKLFACNSDHKEINIELKLRKSRIRDRFFYAAVIQDITEEEEMRRTMEADLEVLKVKVQILSIGEELARTGCWLWDLTKDEMLVSEGYKAILGIETREKYIPKEIRSKVWDEDQDIVDAALRRAFAGEGYDITFRMIRSIDFKVIFIRSVVRPIVNKDGIVVFLHGSTTLIETLNIKDASNRPLTLKS